MNERGPKKKCFKCGASLPLSEFYKHRNMADGYLGKCKTCTKLDVRHREEKLQRDPEWVASERRRHREKYIRLGRTFNRDMQKHREASDRWAVANQDKRTAHSALAAAVRSGKIKKPSQCSACYKECPSKQLHGHHDDYTKPLEVRWLCAVCHGLHHRKDTFTFE